MSEEVLHHSICLCSPWLRGTKKLWLSFLSNGFELLRLLPHWGIGSIVSTGVGITYSPQSCHCLFCLNSLFGGRFLWEWFCFDTGSNKGPSLDCNPWVIHLPQCPEYWDYKPMSLSSALGLIFWIPFPSFLICLKNALILHGICVLSQWANSDLWVHSVSEADGKTCNGVRGPRFSVSIRGLQTRG